MKGFMIKRITVAIVISDQTKRKKIAIEGRGSYIMK